MQALLKSFKCFDVYMFLKLSTSTGFKVETAFKSKVIWSLPLLETFLALKIREKLHLSSLIAVLVFEDEWVTPA